VILSYKKCSYTIYKKKIQSHLFLCGQHLQLTNCPYLDQCWGMSFCSKWRIIEVSVKNYVSFHCNKIIEHNQFALFCWKLSQVFQSSLYFTIAIIVFNIHVMISIPLLYKNYRLFHLRSLTVKNNYIYSFIHEIKYKIVHCRIEWYISNLEH